MTVSRLSVGGSNAIELGGGKILQIVRATDSTDRAITAGALTDVTGMSITITPQKSTSALLIVVTSLIQITIGSDNQSGIVALTDSSNVKVPGAQQSGGGISNYTGVGTRSLALGLSMVGYATPATTSPVTYKVRAFASGTITFLNATSSGQLLAIEVSA